MKETKQKRIYHPPKSIEANIRQKQSYINNVLVRMIERLKKVSQKYSDLGTITTIGKCKRYDAEIHRLEEKKKIAYEEIQELKKLLREFRENPKQPKKIKQMAKLIKEGLEPFFRHDRPRLHKNKMKQAQDMFNFLTDEQKENLEYGEYGFSGTHIVTIMNDFDMEYPYTQDTDIETYDMLSYALDEANKILGMKENPKKKKLPPPYKTSGIYSGKLGRPTTQKEEKEGIELSAELDRPMMYRSAGTWYIPKSELKKFPEYKGYADESKDDKPKRVKIEIIKHKPKKKKGQLNILDFNPKRENPKAMRTSYQKCPKCGATLKLTHDNHLYCSKCKRHFEKNPKSPKKLIQIRKNPYIKPQKYPSNCGLLVIKEGIFYDFISYAGEDWDINKRTGEITGHGTTLKEYYGRKCVGFNRENPQPTIRPEIQHKVARGQGSRKPKGYKYSREMFILKYGRYYKFKKLPKGLRSGSTHMELGHCYRNSYEAVNRYRYLTYVEGYAIRKFSSFGAMSDITLHAWTVDNNGRVYDFTWDEGIAYFGIPFNKTYLNSEMRKRRGTEAPLGLIDDYVNYFPLLKGDIPDKTFLQKEYRKNPISKKDYKEAIDGEKWAIKDYTDMLKSVTPKERKVIKHILDEEKEHLVELIKMKTKPNPKWKDMDIKTKCGNIEGNYRPDTKEVHVTYLGIKEKYRNRGWATYLFKKMYEKTKKETDAKVMLLWTTRPEILKIVRCYDSTFIDDGEHLTYRKAINRLKKKYVEIDVLVNVK